MDINEILYRIEFSTNENISNLRVVIHMIDEYLMKVGRLHSDLTIISAIESGDDYFYIHELTEIQAELIDQCTRLNCIIDATWNYLTPTAGYPSGGIHLISDPLCEEARLLEETVEIVNSSLSDAERLYIIIKNNGHSDDGKEQSILKAFKVKSHELIQFYNEVSCVLRNLSAAYNQANEEIGSSFLEFDEHRNTATITDSGNKEYSTSEYKGAIDPACQDDTVIIEDTKSETESVATSIAESSINTIMSEQERSAMRRKLLSEALRRGEPVTIASTGDISNSTTTEIAEERYVATGDIESLNYGITVPDGKLAGGHGMCQICGTIFHHETNYCPKCGRKAEIEKPAVELDKVQFSAVAPQTLIKGDYSIIEIIMYEEAFRYVVDEAIANAEEPAKETKSGRLIAEKNTMVSIHISSPDIEIKDNNEVQTWQGDYLSFEFAVKIPEQYKKNQILLVASVYFNDIIATRLKFIVKCKSQVGQKIEISRDDVLSAFVSYASQDRQRVAIIIQGMKKARPDMDIFFDVDSLRSGDDWEKSLWNEIDRRDILFLCWSRYARASKWVDAEWRYALKQKGADYIEPVPIDPPGSCPPPDELSSKHFNDKLLYIINASEASSQEREH